MILKQAEQTRFAGTVTAVAAVLAAVVACSSPRQVRKLPPGADPRSAAVEATLNQEWPEAAAYWDKVLTLSGEQDVVACKEAATALANLREWEGTLNILERCLDENPREADLLAMKGDALVELGFRRSAEACYERCLKFDPNRIAILCSLGHLRLELDRETAAVDPLQRALDLGCERMDTRERLAIAYRDSGKPIEAWMLFASRIGLEPAPTAEFIVQGAELSLNRTLLAEYPDATAIALVWLERSLLLHPQHTESLFQHGVISEQLENYEDAINSYKLAEASEPGFLPALTHLALLFAELDHEGPCREAVARAAQLESNNARRLALLNLLAKFD